MNVKKTKERKLNIETSKGAGAKTDRDIIRPKIFYRK